MGNILYYLHRGHTQKKTTMSYTLDPYDSSEFSSESSEEYNEGEESDDVRRFRLPCGKIELYSELKDHGTFGKAFKKINWDWGTGPYKEWENMIVGADAIHYKYLKPYTKDINGEFHKNDDGELFVCKNCEAYATWERCDNVMIRIEGCTNCFHDNYYNKIVRIQRYWRKYNTSSIL